MPKGKILIFFSGQDIRKKNKGDEEQRIKFLIKKKKVGGKR